MANCTRCNNANNTNGNTNGRKRRRCGCMRMCRGPWEHFPYYTGPCPNAEGCYSCTGGTNCRWVCDEEEEPERECCRRCWRHRCDCRPDDCECVCDCDDDDAEGEEEEDACKCRKCCRRKRRRCAKPCCCIFAAFLPLAIGPNGIIPLVRCKPGREENFDVNSGLVTVEKKGTYLATYTVQVPETLALDTSITLNVDNASQTTAVTQVTTEAGASTACFTGQAIFQADAGDTVSLRSSESINATDPARQPIFTLSMVKL